MHLNQLFFNAQFVVIPSVSKCAYNQWKLNTFAYCGFGLDKMRLAAITKINGIFKVAIFTICSVWSAYTWNRDSQLSLFLGVELYPYTIIIIE